VFGIDMTVQELSLFMLFRRMVKQTFRTKRYEIAFFLLKISQRNLKFSYRFVEYLQLKLRISGNTLYP